MLLGRRVEPPPRRAPQDCIDSRPFFARGKVNRDLPDLAAVHEGVVLRERGGTQLTAEIYVPHGEGPFPAVVYLHGGAWVGGSARGTRKVAMGIAAAGHVVVSADYGLAPEHPFPWAVEDAVYATRWAALHVAEYGGDPDRMTIGGESAGANLAAAVLVHLAGGGGRALDEGDLAGVPAPIAGALFVYGIFDFPGLMRRPGSNVGAVEVAFNQAYLGEGFPELQTDPLASPAHAPCLDRFPPAYLTCGDEDSLLPQTTAMAAALARAGVPVELSVVQGGDHAFIYLDDLLSGVHEERMRLLAWLRDATTRRTTSCNEKETTPT